MQLTNENYFSKEASMQYFGVSQIKSFMDCEARALAECRGEWKGEESTALLVGSYVDAWFEGTLDKFKENHPDIFKRDGTLKADYVKADEIIERAQKDPLFMEYMSGQKQVIKTGTIDNYEFKIKMDSYHPGDKIVDLKCMRSLDRIMGVSLVEHWGYDLQGAVYQAIEGNNLPFYLAILTKEDYPDIELVEIEQEEMDARLNEMKKHLARFYAIKAGTAEPERCGRCAYCRATKKLKEPIKAGLLGFNNKEIKFVKGEK